MKNQYKIIYRYSLLLVALFIMALGVSLSIKANLGTSPISCIPYVLSLGLTQLTVGEWTIIFNILLIIGQILILQKDFEKKQLLQSLIVIAFGYFTDLNLWIINGINPTNYINQWILCIISCFVLAFGIFIEIKTETLVLPGEGFILAISKRFKKEFSKIKPISDSTMVIIGAILSIYFLGQLVGVREGTIFSAIILGFIIQFYNKTIEYHVNKIFSKIK